jgi:hypothetical protein
VTTGIFLELFSSMQQEVAATPATDGAHRTKSVCDLVASVSVEVPLADTTEHSTCVFVHTFAAADEWDALGTQKKSPVKKVAKLGSKKLGGKKLAKPQKTKQVEITASAPELEPEPEPELEPEPEPEPELHGDGWEDDGDGWPEDDELPAGDGPANAADAEAAAVDESAPAAEAGAARENRLHKLAQPDPSSGAEMAPAQDVAPQTAAEPAPVLDDFADAPDIPDDFDDAPDFDDDF